MALFDVEIALFGVKMALFDVTFRAHSEPIPDTLVNQLSYFHITYAVQTLTGRWMDKLQRLNVWVSSGQLSALCRASTREFPQREDYPTQTPPS